VKNWFKSWYGANNAVLVLAGDIDLATAKEKVTKYFGDIAPTASVPKLKTQIAARTTATRETAIDNVPQTRIYKVWNVPQFGTTDFDRLRLFAILLGGSQSSRLEKRLTHTDKIADRVSTSVRGQELASGFTVTADVKKGVDPAKVEAAIDEELAKLIADGPTAAEVEQARAVWQAGFVRGIERIGGFGGKSDVLAECLVYAGTPNCYRWSLA